RPLPGTSEPIRRYVLENTETRALIAEIERLLAFCMPRFEREGRSYLTVGIGCTGGRHRSVVIAVELARLLSERLGTRIDVVHRDVERVTLEESRSGTDSPKLGSAGGGARP